MHTQTRFPDQSENFTNVTHPTYSHPFFPIDTMRSYDVRNVIKVGKMWCHKIPSSRIIHLVIDELSTPSCESCIFTHLCGSFGATWQNLCRKIGISVKDEQRYGWKRASAKNTRSGTRLLQIVKLRSILVQSCSSAEWSCCRISILSVKHRFPHSHVPFDDLRFSRAFYHIRCPYLFSTSIRGKNSPPQLLNLHGALLREVPLSRCCATRWLFFVFLASVNPQIFQFKCMWRQMCNLSPSARWIFIGRSFCILCRSTRGFPCLLRFRYFCGSIVTLAWYLFTLPVTSLRSMCDLHYRSCCAVP